MGTATYILGEAPDIRIKTCQGDLEIAGRQGGEVLVRSNSMPHSIQRTEGLTIEECEDDLRLTVPLGATIRIERVEGDVRAQSMAGLEIATVEGELEISNVRDHLELKRVEGDARIRDAGRLTLSHVEGDLTIEAVSGPCIIRGVDGDVRVRDAGNVEFDHIGGDLSLTGVNGSCRVRNVDNDARVGEVANLSLDHVGGDLTVERAVAELSFRDVDGDARLRGSLHRMERAHVGGDLSIDATFAAGETYTLDVDGDTSLSVPGDADLALHADVDGDVAGVERRGQDEGPVDAIWGGGGARLMLRVGGDLNVRGPRANGPGAFAAPAIPSAAVVAPETPEVPDAPAAHDAPGVTPVREPAGDPDLALLEAVASGELSPEEAEALLSR